MPPASKKMSIPRMALFAVATVATFLVLKFVFSVTMVILKYGIIAALAVRRMLLEDTRSAMGPAAAGRPFRQSPGPQTATRRPVATVGCGEP